MNLSNFIDIFTYYFLHFSCSAPLLSVPPTPAIRTASATCKTKTAGRPSEHAPSSRKHVTANAGSNPTEEGGFADRGGRVRRPRRECSPTEEGGIVRLSQPGGHPPRRKMLFEDDSQRTDFQASSSTTRTPRCFSHESAYNDPHETIWSHNGVMIDSFHRLE